MSFSFFKFSSIITSLLASSCCIIQLILNLFSVGCAGFAILDRYEIYFITITFILMSISFRRDGLTKKNIITVMICVLLISSRYLLESYIKNLDIPKNFTMIVEGVKCNGCAQKLCSELKKISEYCSIDELNPPIAKVSLLLPLDYTETLIKNYLLGINMSYKVLESKFY